MRIYIFAPLLLAIPGVAAADPLSFDDAIKRALADAPGIRATALGVDAAHSAARSADALPDPKLALGLDNFPISGPPAGSFTRDEMTMARIGVQQDMPNLAKRHARLGRAQADITAAEVEALVRARDVRLGAALAWIDLAYAGRRLKAIDNLLGNLRPLLGTAPAGVASGASRPAEALESEQALAALEDRRSEIIADIGRARAELSRWTGDPSPEAVGELPSFAVDPVALRTGLEQNPTLTAALARSGQADADVRLARAEKRPDWSWDVAYQRRDSRYGDMVSAGVTISLPLFASRRQDPMIAARAAEAGKARAEQEDARRGLAVELDTGLADHVMHHEQWMRANATLLPLAEQQVSLERASYAAGRAGLKDVLRAHVALADVRLMTLDREAAVARDAARLNLLFGSDDQ